ncbi:YunG family protein [Streptomyces sparsus]
MTTWTPAEIERALRASWAADTCSPDDLARTGWSSDNPALGHCDVTALVVNDVFGGDLVLAEVHLGDEQHGHHWWNQLPTGTQLDLTRDQFRLGQVIGPGRVVRRPAGRLPRRWDAYQLLRRRFRQQLSR